MLTVLSGVAQFECEMTLERQRAGFLPWMLSVFVKSRASDQQVDQRCCPGAHGRAGFSLGDNRQHRLLPLS
jgi:hypothetical protein